MQDITRNLVRLRMAMNVKHVLLHARLVHLKQSVKTAKRIIGEVSVKIAVLDALAIVVKIEAVLVVVKMVFMGCLIKAVPFA